MFLTGDCKNFWILIPRSLWGISQLFELAADLQFVCNRRGLMRGRRIQFLVLLFSLVVVGCGSANSANDTTTQNSNSSSNSNPSFIYSELHWDTTGGGDLHYTVTPIAANTFTVNSITAMGQSGFKTLTISPAQNSSLAMGLSAIFSGQDRNWSYVDTNLYGGTWTSFILTAISGQKTTYKNINSYSNQTLWQLSQFVYSNK